MLLEKLAASPTDSLTYYAFAEDNYSGRHGRTETDSCASSISARSKREYKLAESGGDMEGEDGEFASLEELIARQPLQPLNRATAHWQDTKPSGQNFH